MDLDFDDSLLNAFLENDLDDFTCDTTAFATPFPQPVSLNQKCQPKRHSPPMNKEQIEQERERQIPSSTKSHNHWAQNLFDDWMKQRNEKLLTSEASETENLLFLSEVSSDGHEKLESISKEKLASCLPYFFHEIRKQNSDLYPGETLRQLFYSIQRFIRQRRRLDWELVKDPLFLNTRDALDAAMKKSTEMGLSLKKKIASPISNELEDKLWSSGLLGSNTPKTLIRTLVWLITKNCGLRGGNELRRLKWGEGSQLTVTHVEDGTEVLRYNEDISKTFKGGFREHHVQPKEVTVFPSTNKERCLIQLHKKFIKLRPRNDSTGAYFLQCHPKYSNSQWYLNSPMGHNTLGGMIRNLMDAAGADNCHYSNQSGRRTAVTQIYNATGSKTLAKKISGHRSDCVMAYNEIPERSLKLASNILTNSITTKTTTTATMENEAIQIHGPKNKHMKVEIDGEQNKIMISFE